MSGGKPLRIGVAFPLTDEGDWIGKQCLHAARMACDLAVEQGSIRRDQVEILAIDARHPRADAYDSSRVDAESRRVVDELARDGATVLVGTISSAMALRLAELAPERGILHWEAVAAADELTRPDRTRVFRLDATAGGYGLAAASFAAETLAPAWKVTPARVRTAIASMEEDFCRSVAASFERAARASALDVVGRVTFPARGADMDAVASSLRDLSPDVVFWSGFGPIVPEFWRAARRGGLTPKAFIGNGAWALAHRVEQLGPDLDGVFLVDTPHVSSMSAASLSRRAQEDLAWWKAHCGDPHSTHTAVDRDLVFVATLALLRDVLPRASSTSVDDLAAAAVDVDVPEGGTILGYGLRFDGRRDNTRAFGAILQWQDGRRVTVAPGSVASAAARTEPLVPWDRR